MDRNNMKEMIKKIVKASLALVLFLGASFIGDGQAAEASGMLNVPEQVLVNQPFNIELPGSGYYIDFSVPSEDVSQTPQDNGSVVVTFCREGTFMINLIKDGTWIQSYPIVVNNHTIRADHDHDGLLDIADIVRYAKNSTLLTVEDIFEMLENISSIYATGNRAPIDNGILIFEESNLVGKIAENSLYNSEEVFFSDPDEDSLTYTVHSADNSIAEAWIHQDTIMIRGKVVGSTDITITAYDWLGKSVSRVQKYNVITDHLPYMISDYKGLPKVWNNELWAFIAGSSPVMIDLTQFFADPDGYDLLFSLVDPEDDPEEEPEEDPEAGQLPALIDIDGNYLIITPNAQGNMDISLIIDNLNGGIIESTISITVDEL